MVLCAGASADSQRGWRQRGGIPGIFPHRSAKADMCRRNLVPCCAYLVRRFVHRATEVWGRRDPKVSRLFSIPHDTLGVIQAPIHCAPMLLSLGEAAGVSTQTVSKAGALMLRFRNNSAAQCAVVQEHMTAASSNCRV
jgi:hypothetical protein